MRRPNQLQAKASYMALQNLREEKRLILLSPELCFLGTFLQNISTPYHHASRFPEDPSAEVLGRMVTTGSSSIFFITVLIVSN